MQHRNERVGDLVQQVLARLLAEEVRDPRLGFVTVTGVRMSPDLKHARVYVSFIGAEPERSLAALNHAAAFLRRGVAREARLRHTPELRFVLDESIAGGARVERLLEDLREHAPNPDEDKAGAPGDST